MANRGLAWAAACVSALALGLAACAAPPEPPQTSASDMILLELQADPGATVPTEMASSIVYVRNGNPDGTATIPAAAREVDTSSPDHVVGNGTAASCTSAALASAVRGGGVVTFDCGPDPLTINLTQTLLLCNTDTCRHPWQGGTPVDTLVVDGGDLITISGQDQRGIFYANTCEESFGWLTSRCDLETRPAVVFQNISLTRGNATSSPAGLDVIQGGGAIAMRGGSFKAYNVSFTDNRCMVMSSDGGGGAVRLTGQQGTSYIVNSTLDNNRCANGGAISGLHASIQVLNSMVTNNTATGTGASSGQGGNGGALYGDGNLYHYLVDGTIISGNYADEGGPGIFYVSNNRTGTLTIRNSTIVDNSGQNFYTAPYRDIFYLGGGFTVTGSTVE